MATRGDVGSDASSVSPTTTTATSATEDQGQMQEQQDQGVGPFASVGDEASPFAATGTGFTATWTPDTAISGSHDDSDRKDSIPPADLAASPRSGAARFVAPSSYLRPLAPTRDRDDHHTSQDRTTAVGEAGAKRPMHPLDREQREGLVSGFSALETFKTSGVVLKDLNIG
jgi:hypothetical protein